MSFDKGFTTRIQTGIVEFPICENVYVDLKGLLRPRKFPASGLWHFDGQFWYLPKRVGDATGSST